jgi:ribosomal protein L11 methyltransferase
VVANILAKPLVELAPLIAGAAISGAPVALSGLLTEQAEMVQEAYRDSCWDFSSQQQEEWLIVTATRR